MNEQQLVAYMKDHGLMCKAGKPDTLEAAAALERRGIISKVGDWSGPSPGVVYHMTQKGVETFSLFRPSPLTQFKDVLAGSKAKGTLPMEPIIS